MDSIIVVSKNKDIYTDGLNNMEKEFENISLKNLIQILPSINKIYSTVMEAPSDDKQYVRKNKTWEEVKIENKNNSYFPSGW